MSKNLIETIGNTPLINLQKIGSGKIFVKIEKTNPAGSIKDRPAYYMLKDAIDSGKLKPGMTIVEPTSGNTGIALAMLGSQLGYKVVLVMPDTMSIERRNLIKAYGAELLLTPGSEGMQGSENKAAELAANSNYFMPDQFDNPANPLSHEKTTGMEIIDALPQLTGFIAGVGTGGTITGVGRSLKQHNPKIKIWAMEPAESPLITEGTSAPHKIQGIGANFIPQNLDLTVVDQTITISSDAALDMAKRLGREEGLLVGISSGANVAAALKMSEQIPGDIVTVLPDTAERYLSTALFEDN
jgi:cysteine synthase A